MGTFCSHHQGVWLRQDFPGAAPWSWWWQGRWWLCASRQTGDCTWCLDGCLCHFCIRSQNCLCGKSPPLCLLWTPLCSLSLHKQEYKKHACGMNNAFMEGNLGGILCFLQLKREYSSPAVKRHKLTDILWWHIRLLCLARAAGAQHGQELSPTMWQMWSSCFSSVAPVLLRENPCSAEWLGSGQGQEDTSTPSGGWARSPLYGENTAVRSVDHLIFRIWCFPQCRIGISVKKHLENCPKQRHFIYWVGSIQADVFTITLIFQLRFSDRMSLSLLRSYLC